MKLKRKSILAGLISAAIIFPVATNASYANGNNDENVQQKSTEYRSITGNGVNFRKGPGTNYSSISKLNKGTQVEFLGTEGSWTKLKYNSTEGYVHSDYVSSSSSNDNTEQGSTDNTVKSDKVVTGSSVNFRKGPGTNHSVITALKKGTKVGYISESNGWAKVSYNGTIGYMSANYLGNVTTTPDDNTNSGDNNQGSTDDTVKSDKVVTGNSVNFRKGPGTNYSVIKSLSRGTKVGYISESNGWAKVSYNGTIGYMSANYLGDAATNPGDNNDGNTSIPNGSKADAVIEYAKKQLGKPYVWGAEGPNSFDCSGYTQYVFKNSVGVTIPRVSRDQSKYGQSVSRSNLQKGDLIFFDTDKNGSVNHVGIYMGNNQFIHASSGSSSKKVVISEINSFYSSAYVNARRVL